MEALVHIFCCADASVMMPPAAGVWRSDTWPVPLISQCRGRGQQEAVIHGIIAQGRVSPHHLTQLHPLLGNCEIYFKIKDPPEILLNITRSFFSDKYYTWVKCHKLWIWIVGELNHLGARGQCHSGAWAPAWCLQIQRAYQSQSGAEWWCFYLQTLP